MILGNFNVKKKLWFFENNTSHLAYFTRDRLEWVDSWIQSYTNHLWTKTRTRTLYWSNLHFSRKFNYQFEIFHNWIQTVFQFQYKIQLSTSIWTFNLEITNELQVTKWVTRDFDWENKLHFIGINDQGALFNETIMNIVSHSSPNETIFFDSRDSLSMAW